MPRSPFRLLALIVPVLVYLGALAYAYCRGSNDWPALQTWAMALTGLVVIWYTWETRELRYAAYAQMDLQIRPYVVLQTEGNGFLVTNFGNGAALHVRVEPVVVSVEERIELQFLKTVPVLRSGESGALEVTCFKEGKPTSDIYKALLNPKHTTEEFDVTVRFDDLELNQYATTQRISPNNIVVATTT